MPLWLKTDKCWNLKSSAGRQQVWERKSKWKSQSENPFAAWFRQLRNAYSDHFMYSMTTLFFLSVASRAVCSSVSLQKSGQLSILSDSFSSAFILSPAASQTVRVLTTHQGKVVGAFWCIAFALINVRANVTTRGSSRGVVALWRLNRQYSPCGK